ncbi:MAG TPA: hypothetical protein VEH77_18225 [Roseiarcus sp.]|nr:hypothetical protein [Roseiarcus sp.]
MTRKTIDYARLGVVACEAFMEGPAAFADFVRTTLSIAAAVHAIQTATRDKQLELLDSSTPLSDTRH